MSKVSMLILICSFSVESRRKFRLSRYLCCEGSQTRLYKPATRSIRRAMLTGRNRLRNLASVDISCYLPDLREPADSCVETAIAERQEIAKEAARGINTKE